MNALTITDISTSVDSQPRVLDLRLAEALGFSVPRDIRKLIRRHIEALKRFGEVCATWRKPTSQGGRPGREFWLNRKQALFITAKSDTERAADVTVEMVTVFDEYLGAKAQPQAAFDPALSRDGLAMMRVGRKTLLVDTSRFEHLRPDDKAVVFFENGRLAIQAVTRRGHQNWQGRRSAHTRKKLPTHYGDGKVCLGVQIIGLVVSEFTSARGASQAIAA